MSGSIFPCRNNFTVSAKLSASSLLDQSIFGFLEPDFDGLNCCAILLLIPNFQYKIVTKKVIDQKEYTEKVITPAVYKTIKTSVVDTPSTTKEIAIPGICMLVKTKVLNTPASERKIIVPAKYATYKTKTKVSNSYIRWQSILCKTNTKPDIISSLQKALQAKGYPIDTINGEYNLETKKAVNSYQEDNSLSKGALTLKTLESLGLN